MLVSIEHWCLDGGMCFVEANRDKTQISLPSHKCQTTDGSCCRGKQAAAIERDREGGAGGNEGGEDVQERFPKCFIALLTVELCRL